MTDKSGIRFQGTIDQNGYHLPPGDVSVMWVTSQGQVVFKKLARDVFPPSDLPGGSVIGIEKRGRYGENDDSLSGAQTRPAFSSEHGGGIVGKLVRELFIIFGVGRLPKPSEVADFGFRNFPGVNKVTTQQARAILPDFREGDINVPGEGDLAKGAELNPYVVRVAGRSHGEKWQAVYRGELVWVQNTLHETERADIVLEDAEPIPDPDPPNPDPTPEIETLRAEINALNSKLSDLHQQLNDSNLEKSRLLEENQSLSNRVKLAVPAGIQATLRDILHWREIPSSGGRIIRVRALVNWINGEVSKRS